MTFRDYGPAIARMYIYCNDASHGGDIAVENFALRSLDGESTPVWYVESRSLGFSGEDEIYLRGDKHADQVSSEIRRNYPEPHTEIDIASMILETVETQPEIRVNFELRCRECSSRPVSVRAEHLYEVLDAAVGVGRDKLSLLDVSGILKEQGKQRKIR